MDFLFLVKGLLIGLSIAAPVGPIGMLTIQRTLTKGRIYGLATGMGAATADGLYGCIAAFGLTFISSFLVNQQSWLKVIGGLFLCYLGIKTFLSHAAQKAADGNGSNLLLAYATTVFLTLTNPTTILSFVAVFAGLGLGAADNNYGSASLLVLGVFCGSAMWWLFLTGGIELIRNRLKPGFLDRLNQLSGVIIFGFGVLALASLIFS